MRLPTRRISTALMWAIGIVLVVSSIGAGIFVYQLARGTLIRQGQHEVVTIASAMQTRLTAEAKAHPTRTPIEDLGDMATGQRYVLLTTSAGQPIASSGSLPPISPQQGWNQISGTGWINGTPDHSVPFVFTKTPVPIGNHTDLLVVVAPLYRTAALLGILKSALLAGDAMLIISGLLAVIVIVRQFIGPLKDLENSAQRIARSPHQTDDRLAVTTRFGEIQSLVDSFNRMLDKIFSAQEREREFLSNAAHALRTPLQVLTGYAHALTQWTAPGDRDAAIAAIVRETRAMKILTDRLLELSRTTQLEGSSLEEPIALAAFFDDKLPDFRDVCMHHALEYIGPYDANATIKADPLLLESLLRILLENADQYGSPETSVTLRVVCATTNITVQVENLGPEISAAEQSHLFERFYRGRQPASSEHVGLGLSIADALVSAMEARWTIQSQAGKTLFGITFAGVGRPPLAASSQSAGETKAFPIP